MNATLLCWSCSELRKGFNAIKWQVSVFTSKCHMKCVQAPRYYSVDPYPRRMLGGRHCPTSMCEDFIVTDLPQLYPFLRDKAGAKGTGNRDAGRMKSSGPFNELFIFRRRIILKRWGTVPYLLPGQNISVAFHLVEHGGFVSTPSRREET